MKTTSAHRVIRCAALLVLSTLNPHLSTAFAQGTAFTYQGRLNDGANPADGIYDLRFTIYDSTNSPGVVIAGPITNAAVVVSNGLLSVTLDPGASAFTGAARWLEIGARTNGGGAFSILAPRQRIAPAPYAITAGNLTGIVPSGGLSGVYSNAVTFNHPANTFSGNGSGVTNINAALLDGLDSSQFLRSDVSDSIAGSLTVNSGGTTDAIITEGGISRNSASDLGFNFSNPGAGSLVLFSEGNVVWHAGIDGSGSGLDADLLDGLSSSDFVQSTNGVMLGSLFMNSEPGADIFIRESGINRASTNAETFGIQNLGTGSMSLVTDEIDVAVGSAATPSYSFMVDQDTGMFRPVNNTVALATTGAERLRIDGTGNVAIGTNQISGRLHVVQNSSTFEVSQFRTAIIENQGSVSLSLRSTNNNSSLGYGIYFERGVGQSGAVMNMGNDNILRFSRHVFTSTGGAAVITPLLNLNLTNGLLGVLRTAVTNVLEVQGEASKTVAGSWFANSDRRIKTDVRDINGARETLMKLHPVIFRYTEEWKQRNPGIADRDYYNFIAQEYREVFPDSVKGSGEYLANDPAEILQIDTHNAGIVTLKAVQELIAENAARRAENAELKRRLDALEETIRDQRSN